MKKRQISRRRCLLAIRHGPACEQATAMTQETQVEADARPLSVKDVSRALFTRQLIDKTHATALRGAPAFQLLMRPVPSAGTVMYLEDGPNTYLRYEDDARQFGLTAARLWTV